MINEITRILDFDYPIFAFFTIFKNFSCNKKIEIEIHKRARDGIVRMRERERESALGGRGGRE